MSHNDNNLVEENYFNTSPYRRKSNQFRFFNYRSPFLQFLPRESRKLRKFEHKYENRIKRIAKQNRQHVEGISNQVMRQACMDNKGRLEGSFIDTVKLVQTIDMIEGNFAM